MLGNKQCRLAYVYYSYIYNRSSEVILIISIWLSKSMGKYLGVHRLQNRWPTYKSNCSSAH
jgi:hypothetical protein